MVRASLPSRLEVQPSPAMPSPVEWERGRSKGNPRSCRPDAGGHRQGNRRCSCPNLRPTRRTHTSGSLETAHSPNVVLPGEGDGRTIP